MQALPNIEEFLEPNTWDQIIKVSEEVTSMMAGQTGEDLSEAWEHTKESAIDLVERALERLTLWY
ncbi:hypothetical protein DYI26_08995 [Halomonas litopenaei]|nr:hypothetical protein [Halomonas litopenaei]